MDSSVEGGIGGYSVGMESSDTSLQGMRERTWGENDGGLT